MNEADKRAAEKIRGEYLPKSESKLDRLRKLDGKVKLPAEIFAYILGVAGALVLGVGMCLAMKIIGDLMPLGIAVGLIGIAIVAANYPVYTAFLNFRKKKYAAEIIAIGDEPAGE